MKPSHDLTLSAMFKRIAYDISEEAIGETFDLVAHGKDCPDEEYSEQLANNLLQFYEDELRRKEEIYNKGLLHPKRIFINGWDLWEDIQQVKAIIEILKTNKHE